jgi:type III pantothenate kinase
MKKERQIAIVDAGNTRIKVAVFEGGILTFVKVFQHNQSIEIQEYMKGQDWEAIFVSSVLSDEQNSFFFQNIKATFFHQGQKMPFKNGYLTPETLGLDRLANVAAAESMEKGKNKLIIDIGTCIKYDFIDADGMYQGGAISPGVKMRYEALNHFTGRLPLLEPGTAVLTGRNTNESLHAGVLEGTQGEINHFIERYILKYSGLTIFVTGGDANRFEFPSNCNIFANENLTTLGLFYIHKLNA